MESIYWDHNCSVAPIAAAADISSGSGSSGCPVGSLFVEHGLGLIDETKIRTKADPDLPGDETADEINYQIHQKKPESVNSKTHTLQVPPKPCQLVAVNDDNPLYYKGQTPHK